MTPPSHSSSRLSRLLATAVLFAAVLAVLALVNRSEPPALTALAASDSTAPAAPGDTTAVIGDLREAQLADPADATIATSLGDAYYQRLRETGNGSLAGRAERSYRLALSIEPDNAAALSGRATLALNDHRFDEGLALAQRAHDAAPTLISTYPALVDGLIEAGRYDAAARELERFVALKPTQAGYLRVSYFRELHGDLPGAAQALRFAISAGSGTEEGSAYVRSLLGNFEAARGNYGKAEAAYREALAVSPGFGDARRGLALLAAGRGDFETAIASLERQLGDPPSPDILITLGEVEEAAGRRAAAREHYATASEIEAKLLRSGSGYDAGVTLNEAKHGDPDLAVEYGRRAWSSAPSVSSADAYAYALYRAGRAGAASRLSAEAMKLGSRDPEFLFRAGVIAHADGRLAAAERHLSESLRQSPRFSALYAPQARQLLTGLR